MTAFFMDTEKREQVYLLFEEHLGPLTDEIRRELYFSINQYQVEEHRQGTRGQKTASIKAWNRVSRACADLLGALDDPEFLKIDESITASLRLIDPEEAEKQKEECRKERFSDVRESVGSLLEQATEHTAWWKKRQGPKGGPAPKRRNALYRDLVRLSERATGERLLLSRDSGTAGLASFVDGLFLILGEKKPNDEKHGEKLRETLKTVIWEVHSGK